MIALLAVLLVAASIACFLWRSRRNYLALPELPASPVPPEPPDVTVVIPARNEEGRVGRAVSSFPGARVVVVDDGSSDGTAREARNAGAEVMAAPPLPQCWLGKPHACRTGARAAATRWILFVDADTWFRPEFLFSAVRYAGDESLDMLTVFLRQERKSLAERILLPYALALYFCGVSARGVNSRTSRDALANGQCLLVRREAYERMGGHGVVAGSAIEDVALARAAKQAGLALRVVRAEHLGFVRMYDGLGSIWQGFRKNSFRFLLVNPAGGAAVIAASIALASYLPALGVLLARELWLTAALFALLPSAMLASWYGGFAPALGAPVAIYLFQAIAVDGMFATLLRRKVLWKGRQV